MRRRVCDVEGCCTTLWPDECEGAAVGEHKCLGPTTFEGVRVTYHNTCTCSALREDDLCWGCYLETR